MAPAASPSIPEPKPKPFQPPPSLSLPPSQFARLQPHSYLLAHLSPSTPSSRPPLRVNGRTKSQFRPVSINTGSLTHTNASAVVRIGDTVAVCGVRAEILSTDDIAAWNVSSSSDTSTPTKRRKTNAGAQNLAEEEEEEKEDEEDDSALQNFHLLVPNLSLNTGCTPSITPGAAPSPHAQSLSHQLLSLLHSSRLVRASDLRILHHPPDLSAINNEQQQQQQQDNTSSTAEPETKAFWTLYIDVLIISHAGNVFDAAWGAVVAALRDTRLPRAWWDMDSEMVLCSDSVAEARPLRLRGLPVASSFGVFERDVAGSVMAPKGGKGEGGDVEKPRWWILADPDAFEESLCKERVCVVVDREGEEGGRVRIVRLEKNGGVAVGRAEVRELVELAAGRWAEWRGVFERMDG
ncbi:hypothetical protein FQN55_007605 [Onygenales sp. PD_40]|nr:hypothetical protein FQN55_007605 [Onygenales sp. PD_40]KAK2800400.1 hypothetical protein FQN51_006126 [Onygenales sp. PD_10]